MFGAEPAKRRPGYANFAIDSPPLKLVLIENKGAAERLNHLGVELADVTLVDAPSRPASAPPVYRRPTSATPSAATRCRTSLV